MTGESGSRQPGEKLTAHLNNEYDNFTEPQTLTLEELGINPKWSLSDIEQAILRLLDDRTKLDEYPAWLQLVYFVGQHKGRAERDAEVQQLTDHADQVSAKLAQLEKQLEPDFAWRKWLARSQDDRVGYPFTDLVGGVR